MNICPNCGYRHLNIDYAIDLAAISLPRRERDVFLRLSQAKGSLVDLQQLIDFVYGDDEGGGPLAAENAIRAHISKLRDRIEPSGWTIKGERFLGYRLVRTAQ